MELAGWAVTGLGVLLVFSVAGWAWTIVKGDVGRGKPASSFEEDGRWYYVYQVLNDRRFPDQLFFLIQGAGTMEPRFVVVDRSQVVGKLVCGDCWARTYQLGKKKPRVVEMAVGDGHAPPAPGIEEKKAAKKKPRVVEMAAGEGHAPPVLGIKEKQAAEQNIAKAPE